jgi:hypothetical protein
MPQMWHGHATETRQRFPKAKIKFATIYASS